MILLIFHFFSYFSLGTLLLLRRPSHLLALRLRNQTHVLQPGLSFTDASCVLSCRWFMSFNLACPTLMCHFLSYNHVLQLMPHVSFLICFMSFIHVLQPGMCYTHLSYTHGHWPCISYSCITHLSHTHIAHTCAPCLSLMPLISLISFAYVISPSASYLNEWMNEWILFQYKAQHNNEWVY